MESKSVPESKNRWKNFSTQLKTFMARHSPKWTRERNEKKRIEKNEWKKSVEKKLKKSNATEGENSRKFPRRQFEALQRPPKRKNKRRNENKKRLESSTNKSIERYESLDFYYSKRFIVPSIFFDTKSRCNFSTKAFIFNLKISKNFIFIPYFAHMFTNWIYSEIPARSSTLRIIFS